MKFLTPVNITRFPINLFRIFTKMVQILSIIKDIQIHPNGSVMIELQKHIYIKSNGHIVLYNPKHYNIVTAKKIYFNPKISYQWFDNRITPYQGKLIADLHTAEKKAMEELLNKQKDS